VLKWGGYGKGEAWGRIPSPYGDVGCELWVRENFWHWGRWGWIEGTTKTGRLRERFFEEGRKIAFGQEEPEGGRAQVRHLVGWHRRPAIYLPKWAPRIRLEVVSLRVERLQAITEEDARAEGVLRECDPNDPDLQFEGNGGEDVGGGHGYTMPRSFVCGFANLWERINGDRAGWDTDPWVWRIGFKLKRSLDQAFARAQDDHEEAGAAGDADLPTGTLFDAATVMRYERIDPETPEE
jgi:hypothetical protein